VRDSDLDGSVTTGGGGVRIDNVRGGLNAWSGGGPVVRDGVRVDRGWGEGDSRGEHSHSHSSMGRGAGRHEDYSEPDDSSDPGDGVATIDEGDDDLGTGDRTSSGVRMIHKAGGSVHLIEAPHGATIQTGGGEVTVGRAAGQVEVETGGGSIHVGPLAGSALLRTGAGSVHLVLDPAGDSQDVSITSGRGDVVIEVPRDWSGTVNLETAYTESADHPSQITLPDGWNLRRETSHDWDDREGTPRRYVRAIGSHGGRGGRIDVRTVNGDVEIRQR
jgi:hypothetical protein